MRAKILRGCYMGSKLGRLAAGEILELSVTEALLLISSGKAEPAPEQEPEPKRRSRAKAAEPEA